jgi:hypothetical protein
MCVLPSPNVESFLQVALVVIAKRFILEVLSKPLGCRAVHSIDELLV